MGPSIDEMKTAASSRAEMLLSQSSGSVLQPSTSAINLNLPREPLRNRLNISNSNPLADSRILPTSSLGQTGATIVSAQENLRTTAQTINGFIQKDRILPDLGELLNGTLVKILKVILKF